MPFYTTQRGGGQHNHHRSPRADISRIQAQQNSYLSATPDWNWNGAQFTASPSVRGSSSSSRAMPLVYEGSSWSPTPSMAPVNAVLAPIDQTTSYPDRYYCPDNEAAVFNSADCLLAEAIHLSPSSQETPRQNIYNPGVPPQAIDIQPHVYPQKARKPRRSEDHIFGSPLRCKWEGCTYLGSFNKESSLIRHIQKLHLIPGSYHCPVQECDKVCNRKDNLVQHMRNAHG